MTNQPKVSIIVPIHDMKNGEFFLWRLVNSLVSQTFKNWELIITKDGKMAENTNSGIKRARGEYIKILYLDDYFSDPLSLETMVNWFGQGVEWLICGTNNNPLPQWTDDIETGNNKLGSPSALMFRNRWGIYPFGDNVFFDERLSWLLDCDLYKRLYRRYGKPQILGGNYITLGEGDHQMTHILTDEQKLAEYELIKRKYAK